MATQIVINITSIVQINIPSTSWATTYSDSRSLELINWWISNIFVPNTTEIDQTLRGMSPYLTSYIIQRMLSATDYSDFQKKFAAGVNTALTEVEHVANTSSNRRNAFLIISFVKLILKYTSLATPWGITESNLIPPTKLAEWEERAYNVMIGPDPAVNS